MTMQPTQDEKPKPNKWLIGLVVGFVGCVGILLTRPTRQQRRVDEIPSFDPALAAKLDRVQGTQVKSSEGAKAATITMAILVDKGTASVRGFDPGSIDTFFQYHTSLNRKLIVGANPAVNRAMILGTVIALRARTIGRTWRSSALSYPATTAGVRGTFKDPALAQEPSVLSMKTVTDFQDEIAKADPKLVNEIQAELVQVWRLCLGRTVNPPSTLRPSPAPGAKTPRDLNFAFLRAPAHKKVFAIEEISGAYNILPTLDLPTN